MTREQRVARVKEGERGSSRGTEAEVEEDEVIRWR
jgi:hypothetical protein